MNSVTFATISQPMNFLAHAHLSGDNDKILLGNFMADAVKGKQWEKYETNVSNGIRLHRKIDTFTDKHPIVKKSINRIKNEHGRYSGVVVDIYYDHFLAEGWDAYHPTTLRRFSKHVYAILSRHYFILPDRTKRMLPFLIAQNWLTAYAEFAGLERVFQGMDRRTGLLSGMRNALVGLEKNYQDLKQDFREFYPELQDFSKNALQDILRADGAAHKKSG